MRFKDAAPGLQGSHNLRVRCLNICAVRSGRGEPLPSYVAAEFEAFLKCGVLAHGLLRLKCQDCRFLRLVAFSCKKRGFCSSYGARRMAQSAAHLSDHVFPAATMVRQWVLTMPVPLRYFCARQPQVQTAAVTLIQRFGGHVNLNIHFHMLHVHGAWSLSEDKTSATFHPAANPSQEELLECVQKIAVRFLKILKQMKLVELGLDGGDMLSAEDDLSSAKAQMSGPMAASYGGFSLHAGVSGWSSN